MRKFLLLFGFMVSVSIACSSPSGSHKFGSGMTATRFDVVQNNKVSALITADSVYIRNADGSVVGIANRGDGFTGEVFGEWFVISPNERIWLGCTDFVSDLGCASK